MTGRIIMGVVFLVGLGAFLAQLGGKAPDRRTRRALVTVQAICLVVLMAMLASGWITEVMQ